MCHHFDLDPVGQNAVKNEVIGVGDDLTPAGFAFTNFVQVWMLSQWLSAFVDQPSKALRGLKVVLSDEGNDLQEVFFCLRMPNDRQH